MDRVGNHRVDPTGWLVGLILVGGGPEGRHGGVDVVVDGVGSREVRGRGRRRMLLLLRRMMGLGELETRLQAASVAVLLSWDLHLVLSRSFFLDDRDVLGIPKGTLEKGLVGLNETRPG